MKKKLCIITTTRSDYGFFKPLISQIKQNKNFDLKIIATGTHLEKKYGLSINEIFYDGIKPIAIKTFVSDTKIGIVETIGNIAKKIGKELIKIKPDLVFIVGDRYETLTIAQLCVALNIPIAHISGGDLTIGANDDMFRHAITKLSQLHFTSCDEFRKRVIQLGEQPDRVFNTGSLSIENINNLKLLSKKAIEEELKINLLNTFLATFHPVTMENNSQNNQFDELLKAIEIQTKYQFIFTLPNQDYGRNDLVKKLNNFAKKNPHKVKIFSSLGSLKYLSIMKHCCGVIGNSSSGILEAPSFKIPTINIGNRQQGRICAKSVINCSPLADDILKALDKIEQISFKKTLKSSINPYKKNNTSKQIVKIVENYLILNKNNYKQFYDLTFL